MARNLPAPRPASPLFPSKLLRSRPGVDCAQALGGSQRHCQHKLRHWAGVGARVRGNCQIAREEMQRHVIDACGQELHEAERRHRCDIVGRDLDPAVLGDQHPRPRPRGGPLRRREIGPEEQFAAGAELLPVRGARVRRRVVGDEECREGS